jgi:octaprenyl-diphosphate synthase
VTNSPTSNQAWTFQSVVEYFARDLKAIEEAIFANLRSRNELLEKISTYITASGGKRLRPLLVVLCARMNGYQGRDHIALGNIVEYLHAATLLHDDVLDNATVRRGTPSANDCWGNHFAVLGGDFLYTSAFDLLLERFPRDIIRVLSRASLEMIEGEVLQRQWMGKTDIPEETYFEIIALKTASLISASCRAGSLLGGADPEQAGRLADFGRSLGTAFQVIDDTLDYTADPEKLGKVLGGDLCQGTVTLPLIYLFQEGDLEPLRKEVTGAMAEGKVGKDTVDKIKALLKERGCGKRSMAMAAAHAEDAKEALRPFSNSPLYPALLSAADYIIHRSH